MNTRSDGEYTTFAFTQFCATGVSSGLATRVALTREPQESWEILLHRVDLLLISFFLYRIAGLLLGCVLLHIVQICKLVLDNSVNDILFEC
jgi:hypothetical protein